MDTSNTMLNIRKGWMDCLKKFCKMVMVIIKTIIREMLNMMTKHNNPLRNKDMDVIYTKIAL